MFWRLGLSMTHWRAIWTTEEHFHRVKMFLQCQTYLFPMDQANVLAIQFDLRFFARGRTATRRGRRHFTLISVLLSGSAKIQLYLFFL